MNKQVVVICTGKFNDAESVNEIVLPTDNEIHAHDLWRMACEGYKKHPDWKQLGPPFGVAIHPNHVSFIKFNKEFVTIDLLEDQEES